MLPCLLAQVGMLQLQHTNTTVLPPHKTPTYLKLLIDSPDPEKFLNFQLLRNLALVPP